MRGFYKAVSDKDVGVFKCPNYAGKKIPAKYELVEEFFVDNSGLGTEEELALTAEMFLEKVKKGLYYAITAEGQFQVYVGAFRKKEGVK